MDDYEKTVGRVWVAFVDERGDLLQEALLTTVPRLGEEVELQILPNEEQIAKSIKGVDMPKMGGFQVLKMLIWGRDKDFENQIDKSLEGVEMPNSVVRNGTVLRVKWTPFVASAEITMTAATVVLKLEDGSPRDGQ